jgi:hypothetical protein
LKAAGAALEKVNKAPDCILRILYSFLPTTVNNTI